METPPLTNARLVRLWREGHEKARKSYAPEIAGVRARCEEAILDAIKSGHESASVVYSHENAFVLRLMTEAADRLADDLSLGVKLERTDYTSFTAIFSGWEATL